METNTEDPTTALERYCNIFPHHDEIVTYAECLLKGIKAYQTLIDEYIEKAAEHWRLERISFVDKNVLRLGVFEMLFSSDVPQKVAIDEAIEIGKKYGNQDSGDFINGILDRILKDHYRNHSSSKDANER